MQTNLLEKEIELYGEKIKIVEWAEKFFSIQIELKIFNNLITKVQKSGDIIENHIFDHKDRFFQDNSAKIMELVISANSELYRSLMKEKADSHN